MNADGLPVADSSAFIRAHPRFVKVVFPEKNPEKLLAGYLHSWIGHNSMKKLIYYKVPFKMSVLKYFQNHLKYSFY